MYHFLLRFLSVILLIGFCSSTFSGIRVQFKDQDYLPLTEWMRFEFKIINEGPTAFNLANTTLTYYFSDLEKTWNCNIWSFLVNKNQGDASTITTSFTSEPSLVNGQAFNLKFTTGTIGPNSECWVLVGINKNYKLIDKQDDYSYVGGTYFKDNARISLTTVGQSAPVWGEKPSSASATRHGDEFTVTSNPIISRIDRLHNSSDPAAAIVNGTLVLITSTDLDVPGSDDWQWPMDGTHLYTTYGENTLCTKWWEHGGDKTDKGVPPILESYNFSWANGVKTQMFAPDIQYVPEQNKIFLYIPMLASDARDNPYRNTWQIGVASTTVPSDVNATTSYYDNFGIAPSSGKPFEFDNTGTWNLPAIPVDPGVFQKIGTNQYYMLYVDAKRDNGNAAEGNPHGNISIAAINADMTSGHSLGKISFAQPYYDYKILTNCMEGPDVSVMHTASGRPYYYMVFSAYDPKWTNHDCGIIGYAMASQSEFESNPTSCWHFKGWIFQDFETTGNNHADLVENGDKHYIFYQQGNPTGYHQRQVFCKEIEISDNYWGESDKTPDGEIIGVTHPDESNLPNLGDNGTHLDNYGCIDGTTKSISRGFIDVIDSTKNNNKNASIISYSSFKNVTENYNLTNFKLIFYITVDAGEKVTVDPRTGFDSGLRMEPLRHIGSNLWGIIISYTGSAIPYGSSFPRKQNGGLWNLSFSIKYNNENHIKSNDPSEPYGVHNNSNRTNRIGVFNLLSDPAIEPPIGGEIPTVDASWNSYKFVRNAQKYSTDADWSYLMLSDANPDYPEGIGIYNRDLNTGSQNQQWYFTKVTETVVNGQPVPVNAYRIRSYKTNGKYMTMDGAYNNQGDSDGPNYGVTNRSLNTDNASQIWILEPLAGIPNGYKIQNFMYYNSPSYQHQYLTRFTFGPSDTYCKIASSKDPNRQVWFIE